MVQVTRQYAAAATALGLALSAEGFTASRRQSSSTRPSSSSSSSLDAYPTSASDVLWTPSWKSGARDEQFGPLGRYCEDLYSVKRRPTRTVTCGLVKFGSEHPIVRQTMATTDTANVDASIE